MKALLSQTLRRSRDLRVPLVEFSYDGLLKMLDFPGAPVRSIASYLIQYEDVKLYRSPGNIRVVAMLKVPPIFKCAACGEIALQGGLILPAMFAFACSSCIVRRRATLYTEAEITNRRFAPWSKVGVASLAAYQNSTSYVPFVCDNAHTFAAQMTGLHCNRCNQTHTWAYDWTLNWKWKGEDGESRSPKKPAPLPQNFGTLEFENKGKKLKDTKSKLWIDAT